MKNLYFVDFENLPILSFEEINPDEDQIVIFVGKNQTKISIETVIQTQKLGKAIVWMRMDGSGRNALDFHIAYYLGHFTASLEAAKMECNIFVVSRDGDYDVLIKHIQSLGHSCKRLTALNILSEVSLIQTNGGAALAVKESVCPVKVSDVAPILRTDVPIAESTKQVKFETDVEVLENLIDQLRKVDKSKRPRAESTLMNHIVSHYQKKSQNVNLPNVLEMLIRRKKISINDNNRVFYHF